jgi:hypothetical protein
MLIMVAIHPEVPKMFRGILRTDGKRIFILASTFASSHQLLLCFRLGPEALLPAFLQVIQTDVADSLICSLRIAEIMNRGLYGK